MYDTLRERYISEEKYTHLSLLDYLASQIQNSESEDRVIISVSMLTYSNSLIKSVVHNMGYRLSGKGAKRPKSALFLTMVKWHAN